MFTKHLLRRLSYNLTANIYFLFCSVRATIERYKKASSDTANGGQASEVNAQVRFFWLIYIH